jgi:hypothetical protein
MRITSCSLIAIALIGIAVSPNWAQAQTRAEQSVTIAAEGRLPHNAPAIAIYRPHQLPHRLVMIDTVRASGADLEAALQTIVRLTERTGADGTQGEIQAIPRPRIPRSKADSAAYRLRERRGSQRLQLLKTSNAFVMIGGIGQRKVMDVIVQTGAISSPKPPRQ